MDIKECLLDEFGRDLANGFGNKEYSAYSGLILTILAKDIQISIIQPIYARFSER